MKTARITAENGIFTLENRWVKRVVKVDENGVLTSAFEFEGVNHLKGIHHEFMFSVNRKLITSYSWTRVREVDGNTEKHVCELTFLGHRITAPDENYQRLELDFAYDRHVITLRYEVAENLPAMRKRIIFKAGCDDTMLESFIFDDTPMAPGSFADCDFYWNINENPTPICVTNTGDAEFLRVYNPQQQVGFYLGNTAPGVLRYFLIYPNWQNLALGYNCSSAPFQKYLNQNESFESAEALTCFYRGKALDGLDDWRELIRTRLPEFDQPDEVMYCSWIPLNKNISESIIHDLAEAAAAAGCTSFVVDDGWFCPNDWQIDPEKFPNGLKPVSDHIHSLGMKFGLWFNIGTDYGLKADDGRFAARMADGSIKRLGFDYNTALAVQCFASGHCDRMIEKLDELATLYNVDYFKMDFSSISSPYGHMAFGCHAKDHFHRGFADSFPEMYAGFNRLRREMKKRHPKLWLDFSFEAFGLEIPTIGALECSELNHLSNHTGMVTDIQSIVRIRRDFYRQTGYLPPERLMHGLPALQGELAVEYLLTSMCGAPLISGDLRNLGENSKRRLPLLTRAYRKLAKAGALTGFEIIASTEKYDAFRRYAADGREMWCVFNRTDEELTLPTDKKLFNAETGTAGVKVPPRDCGMFVTGI